MAKQQPLWRQAFDAVEEPLRERAEDLAPTEELGPPHFARRRATDTCFAPVLGLAEAPSHPHVRARGTFVEVDGIVQPAPAPRFSRTLAVIPRSPARKGEDPDEALRAFGFSGSELARLRAAGGFR